MSDGTDELRFLDPVTFAERRRLKVTAGGTPLKNLNELECVKGEIFANIWKTDHIARIDPRPGEVTGWIDLRGLLSPTGTRGDDVLNGIAYDAARDRLFVTGKLWPRCSRSSWSQGQVGRVGSTTKRVQFRKYQKCNPEVHFGLQRAISNCNTRSNCYML